MQTETECTCTITTNNLKWVWDKNLITILQQSGASDSGFSMAILENKAVRCLHQEFVAILPV